MLLLLENSAFYSACGEGAVAIQEGAVDRLFLRFEGFFAYC